MKTATDIYCRECAKSKRKAVCVRVDQSRLEEGLGHATYECERCHVRYKIRPEGREAVVPRKPRWAGVGPRF
jgi:hypothetical protein